MVLTLSDGTTGSAFLPRRTYQVAVEPEQILAGQAEAPPEFEQLSAKLNEVPLSLYCSFSTALFLLL